MFGLSAFTSPLGVIALVFGIVFAVVYKKRMLGVKPSENTPPTDVEAPEEIALDSYGATRG